MVHFAVTADQLNRTYQAHLRKLGETSELLDAKAMYEISGSRHYISGLYSPETTMIQPASYVRGVVEDLRRDGVLIFERSLVEKFERTGSSWRVLTVKHQIST